MFIKILYSIFVLLMNFLIYRGIQKKINKSQFMFLIIYGASIVFLNYKFCTLSNKLILFLVLFSISIIVLNFFKKNINVFERSNLLDNDKVERIKFVMVNVIMPIMITVYQFLIIWSDKLFDKMTN
jgi:hypothetical protein